MFENKISKAIYKYKLFTYSNYCYIFIILIEIIKTVLIHLVCGCVFFVVVDNIEYAGFIYYLCKWFLIFNKYQLTKNETKRYLIENFNKG